MEKKKESERHRPYIYCVFKNIFSPKRERRSYFLSGLGSVKVCLHLKCLFFFFRDEFSAHSVLISLQDDADIKGE